MTDINWRSGVCLCLRPISAADPHRQLTRGPLDEIIGKAIAWPEPERSRLYISYEAVDRLLSLPQILALADRSDFPVSI